MAIADTKGAAGGAGGDAAGEGSNLRAFKTLRLVKLSKMLRLAHIKRILAKYAYQLASLLVPATVRSTMTRVNSQQPAASSQQPTANEIVAAAVGPLT